MDPVTVSLFCIIVHLSIMYSSQSYLWTGRTGFNRVFLKQQKKQTTTLLLLSALNKCAYRTKLTNLEK